MDTSKSIISNLTNDQWDQRKMKVLVKRDDLIHADVSGNKWRKLKFNIALCQQLKKEAILTFGGAITTTHLLIPSGDLLSIFQPNKRRIKAENLPITQT